MGTFIIMRTGHQYQVSDGLTLQQVNDKLNGSQDRFIEVPLAANAATQPGTPGAGEQVQHLFITPESVSHFIVV